MSPDKMPVNGATTDAKYQEVLTENERLRQRLNEAEQRIHSVEEERDKYRPLADLWIHEHCSEEAWADFNPDDYTVTMEEMIADAKALLEKS